MSNKLHFFISLVLIAVVSFVQADDGHNHGDEEGNKFEPLITYIGADKSRPFKARKKYLTLMVSGYAELSSVSGKLNGKDISSSLSFKEPGFHTIDIPLIKGENSIEIEVSPKKEAVDGVLSSLRQVHKLTINYEPDIPKAGVMASKHVIKVPRKLPPGMTRKEYVEEKMKEIDDSFFITNPRE